ncbi:MAG: DUF4337 domain-containing protein [Verrucomicrobia bacterium]|nr:DUF4337 domain-containing protein [Verrucomicrobiota bacterium]MBI3868471.1 DUF4337 domain-containing protein [Verrucomicrobiota bacterium]
MSEHGVPHHAENHEQKRIGIFISVLAVLMAIVTALANDAANQTLVKQVEASNGFSWYQSKRQRSYMNELELGRIDRELAGAPNDAQRKMLDDTRARLRMKNSEYEKENETINRNSKNDAHLAEVAAHKHHRFEYAEVAIHIAVVLCSLTLLTDSKLFFRIGVAATIVGVVVACSGFAVPDHGAAGPSAPPATQGVPPAPH